MDGWVDGWTDSQTGRHAMPMHGKRERFWLWQSWQEQMVYALRAMLNVFFLSLFNSDLQSSAPINSRWSNSSCRKDAIAIVTRTTTFSLCERTPGLWVVNLCESVTATDCHDGHWRWPQAIRFSGVQCSGNYFIHSSPETLKQRLHRTN